MNVITIEVDIDHGRIVAREPGKLPDVAKGILTILPEPVSKAAPGKRERVQLPLIEGNGTHIINPTPEEIDACLWDD